MAQDLLANGHSLAAIMLAGRWKHTSMPAYYTRNIAVGRGSRSTVSPTGFNPGPNQVKPPRKLRHNPQTHRRQVRHVADMTNQKEVWPMQKGSKIQTQVDPIGEVELAS